MNTKTKNSENFDKKCPSEFDENFGLRYNISINMK